MRKVLALLALIIVVFAAGTAMAAEPIKIGYLAALTGDYAQYGITEVNMAKLVVGDINAKGGILGRKIELIPYDTKTRNEDAVNAVRRMIESDKVCAIVGANSSGINIATAPIVAKGKTPQISTVGTNPFVTVDNKGKVRPYSFRICFTDPYQGALAADLAYNDLKKTKAAILYNVGSDYAQGLREFFVKDYEKLGGKIVADEGFRETDVDFRAQLTTIKNSGADSYPTENGFVPEDVFLSRLPEIAKNALGDACTGSNPRQPSQEEMEKLLKCCYYDTEVDF